MRGVVILSAVLILCLSRFASAACNSNSECATATAPYCFNQTCLGCLVNAHCRASEYCNNAGMCEARPSCGQCNYNNAAVCSASNCVQCTSNSQCASGVCDTVVNVCRPPTSCTNSTVCAGTDRPVCSAAGTCVECLSDTDCSAAFPMCTAAGVCSAQVLRPVLMCSQNSSTPNKRTLYTSFSSTQQNVDVIYPVGSKNALYVVGNETVLLNSGEQFKLVNTTRTYFYPQFFEQIEVDIGVQVTWYLDGVISNLTLDSTSDCPANVSFLVGVADLTYVTNNQQNVSDTIANTLGVDTSRVSINLNVNKRSSQQLGPNSFGVTVADGASNVMSVLTDSTALTNALTGLGMVVTGVQGSVLSIEPIPTLDGASPPYSAPTAGTPVGNSPVAPPAVAAPVASPNAVPVTPVATFPPSTSPSSDVVATPGALDSGIIVAIVVVCVVVAAAVIIIAVVVSRNKKKKSGGGSGSSRMERGSATEMKETTSAALVTTNPAKKVESESSDEDEESGEDVDSSDEDEESEEESGSEVSGSGSGSNEGRSSAEGSGSNEDSASGSGSEESS